MDDVKAFFKGKYDYRSMVSVTIYCNLYLFIVILYN